MVIAATSVLRQFLHTGAGGVSEIGEIGIRATTFSRFGAPDDFVITLNAMTGKVCRQFLETVLTEAAFNGYSVVKERCLQIEQMPVNRRHVAQDGWK